MVEYDSKRECFVVEILNDFSYSIGADILLIAISIMVIRAQIPLHK